MPDLDDQQVWRACIGLDLADRTVLEAEVLIWRVVREKCATLMRQSLNQEHLREPRQGVIPEILDMG